MSLHRPAEPVADNQDFGLAGHLAAIDLMHREALAQLDALVQPWARLWSSRSEVPGAETTDMAEIADTAETAEFPVTGQPPVREAQPIAA